MSLNLPKMRKNYVLSLVAILVCNVLSYGKSTIGDRKKTETVTCYVMPELTIRHPNCESPETGTITIDTPVDNYLYTIDGINYQESPFFDLVQPGTYFVSYKDLSGCESEVDMVTVHNAMPHATIGLISESSLNQTVCMNSSITPISYALGGTATQAVVSGLPAGITTAFADGVFTISGAASTSGIYNFSIVTNGGCPASLSGTIFVKLNAALAWVSSSGSRNQILCAGSPIVPIKYMVANGATGAEASLFPAGISGSFSGGIYTVSGTPLDSGTQNFTITTTGGCSVASSNVTIVVNPVVELNLQCNSQTVTAQSLAFSWESIPGATAYNYSYSINSGVPVSGLVSGNTEFTVPGVLSGQSVVFMINGVNGVPCFNAQSVTCVAELLDVKSFSREALNYFPNPVQDLLFIDSESVIKTVSVFDLLGQKMIETTTNETKLEINLAAFRSGIYRVTVTSDNERTTFRIIKE